MKYYVIINGVSSETIQGLAIESLPAISKPLQRSKQETIDGRDGDIITKLGYSAYDKTLKIGLWGNYDIDEVIKYFDTEGTITFSNEPDMYYNFNILNRIDFINQLEAFRKATITIHCQPFKYKEEETETLELEEHQEEGTSFNLQGTYEAPLQIDLKGNTYQTQLSGKNLFNPVITNNGTAIYTSNCTVSVSNGVISLTATATGRIDFGSGRSAGGTYEDDRGVLIAVEPNTTYQISLSNQTFQRTYINKWDSSKVSLGGNSLYLPNTSYTTDANTYYISLDLVYANAVSGTTYSTTVQVEKGSTPTNYEQYCGGTPSPNPDYPQDIHNVSGNNSVVVCGKNFFDASNLSDATQLGVSVDFNNSEITLNGTVSSAGSIFYWQSAYLRLLEAGTYTFHFEELSGSYSNPDNKDIAFSLYDANGTILGNVNLRGTRPSITFTLDNKQYVRLGIYVNGVLTLNNWRLGFQIEEGSTATTYEAYTGTTYPINLPVENLFNKNDSITTGKTYVNDGTLGNLSTAFVQESYIKVIPNEYYTLSTTNDYSGDTNFRIQICEYDENKTFIQRNSGTYNTGVRTSYSVKLSDNTKYVRLGGMNNLIDELQFEKGSKANSYTPYGTTPIELCKYEEYQDYIYYQNNKWYKRNVIESQLLDGTQTITRSMVSGFTNYRFRVELGKSIITYPVYCDKFVMRRGAAQDIECAYNTTAYCYITIRPDRLTGDLASDFRTWIQDNNVLDYYVLETPTDIEITYQPLIDQLNAIKEATSYNGTTNILQTNNDLPFILDIDYFTGTNEITITNNGNTYSKPTLTLTGSGVIGIYLNDSQIFQVSLGTDETIIIDINNMEAYYDATLKNRQVIGDYNNFRLIAGENKIKLTGNWDKLSVDNYSRWI